MPIRGIRGAVTANADDPEAILSATRELLMAIMEANPSLRSDDIASAFFTVTEDILSAYPAKAARKSLGWEHVPMLCAREIPVPGGPPHCIRVLIHWNTGLPQLEIRHVYLGDAVKLRPDLQQADF
jgi:chorismate mutase